MRIALMLLLLTFSCKTEKLRPGGCLEDKDCGSPTSAFRCEAQTSTCYCRTDQACPGSQFCNTLGFCQDRSGCETNADCNSDILFCDTSSGQCLNRGRCTSDIQCQLGEVCDTKRQQCVAGCKSHGDCPGTSCRCGNVACGCDATTAEGRAACKIGVCDATFCATKDFCRFGEVCDVIPDSGVAYAQCFSDFDSERRPYCGRCTNGGGEVPCGGAEPNFCIIDTRTASTYCGADCSNGQACPRGYGCRDIRIVFTRWQCSATLPCPGNPQLPCATDEECKRGGKCLKGNGSPNGFCQGQCRLREGSSFGYCSCIVDEDCPLESCNGDRCSVSKKKCVNNSDCNTIRCADFDGVGGCGIGQNCTPTNGLTCNEVQ
jgi:hypothetical protein